MPVLLATLTSLVLSLVSATAASSAPAAPAAPAALPAFPGAEGFGALATGGRGGTVYHVTNLNDAGPGSLRDAVSQDNRIIVFDIGGYIALKSPLGVSRKNLTIAGQTAPGDGIGIRNFQVSFSNTTENIIVRYIRVRPGITPKQQDGLSVYKAKNIIFDHVSASWGRDESFSINESENITVQHSIIAEGLLKHSMGGLVQWNTITLHHNLYTTNNDRNPKAKGKIDFVNNVVYNWGADAFVAGGSAGRSDVNVVGNYFIAGPSSKRLDDPISRGNTNFHLFFEGNYFDGNRNGVLDGKPLLRSGVDDEMIWEEKRFDYPPVHTESAPDAYQRVIDSVGASKVRDAVDKRIIENVVKQTGELITDPELVGGFGTLASGTAPLDTDKDGIPDTWEQSHGLNPKDPKDAMRPSKTAKGYVNLEVYINSLVDNTK
jgi:pectate lyase